MNKEDFVKAMTYLATAFNQDLTNENIYIWYDVFKNENYDYFKEAVKNCVKESKYVPTINELIEKVKEVKKDEYLKIVDSMKEDNYFKDSRELDKAYDFIQKNNIPSWLKEDMDNYSTNLKIENVKSLPADTKFDENDPEYLELKKEMEMLYK